MKRRLHSPEQIVQKPRDADAKIASGATVEQVCKEMGISDTTNNIDRSIHDIFSIPHNDFLPV